MARTTFKTIDGYTTQDFLQFGLDHCHSGIELFKLNDPKAFDSAGYLLHLGLEQILKAWHLEVFSEFRDTHNLQSLLQKLKDSGISITLSKAEAQFFDEIDQYRDIRYPNPSSPSLPIGNEFLDEKTELVKNIINQMPQTLLDLIDKIDPTRKGGRSLMKKKIDDF